MTDGMERGACVHGPVSIRRARPAAPILFLPPSAWAGRKALLPRLSTEAVTRGGCVCTSAIMPMCLSASSTTSSCEM